MKSPDIFVFVCFLCLGHSRRTPASQERDHVESYGNSLANLFLAARPSATLNTGASPHPVRIYRRFSSPVMAKKKGGSNYGVKAPQQSKATKSGFESQPKLTEDGEIDLSLPERKKRKKRPQNNKAKWLPFVDPPSYLDGTYAGDVGFDPLGLVNLEGPWFPAVQSQERRLAWLREAEVKHSRLAMLAAVGWPLSELFQGPLSRAFGLPFELELTDGRAPSVLNGNLGSATPVLLFFLLLNSILDIISLDRVYGLTALGRTINKESKELVMLTYTPGDLDFDPLGFYDWYGKYDNNRDRILASKVPEKQWAWYDSKYKEMQLAEIKHGRLAMLAITGFAVQEALYKTPVVDQSPLFFGQTAEIQDYWNGAIIGTLFPNGFPR